MNPKLKQLLAAQEAAQQAAQIEEQPADPIQVAEPVEDVADPDPTLTLTDEEVNELTADAVDTDPWPEVTEQEQTPYVQVFDDMADDLDFSAKPIDPCPCCHEEKEDPRYVDLSSGKRGRGRPRKVGRNARIHLVYDKGGEIRFSSESWKSGPYGFNKAIQVLEWSKQQGLSSDFLVVSDPATLKIFDLRQVKVFPVARRGQPFPTTVEDWEDYLKLSESVGKDGAS